MASLRDIQLAELECLKEIDKICKSNGIKYMLAGGTLLGAIRHKGFIPWDDDLDVYMSYEDFRQFERCFNSKGFFLQTVDSDYEMPFIIYKVRKNNTIMLEKGLEKLNMHQGVWADIIVYIDAAKNSYLKKLQHKLTILLRAYRCRTLRRKNHEDNIFQKCANLIPKKTARWIDKQILILIHHLGSKKSEEYLLLTNGTFRRMFIPKELFSKTADYEFEGGFFPGIGDYDTYLRRHYGDDYMTPKKWGSHTNNYDGTIIDS